MAVAGSLGAAVRRARHSGAGARTSMVAALPRVALSDDEATAAIRRSIWAASTGRLNRAERDWSQRIEARRGVLLADRAATGPSFDSGSEGPAGDLSMKRRRTRIDIASGFMSLPRTWCRLLMRLVRELAPRSCLELGTAFGISGSYLAAGLELNGAGGLTTLEGAEDWAQIAAQSFSELELDGRVEQRVGPIADSLASLLPAVGPVDLAFLDAEHQAKPTLEHFAAMLPHLAPGAIVVLDDVDWPPMREAWRRLAAHERVSHAVPVGRFGLAVLAGGDGSG
jgi:predicted O-methyltransferase YrrM